MKSPKSCTERGFILTYHIMRGLKQFRKFFEAHILIIGMFPQSNEANGMFMHVSSFTREVSFSSAKDVKRA